MREIINIIILTIFLTLITTKAKSQKDIFIKQVEFKLDFISEIDYENEYFMTIKLSKGIKYKFKVNNHIDDYAGVAVVELLDADNLIVTNEISGKYYEQFGFHCNKTGFYDILIRFKENKVGHSTVDIFMTQ